MTHLWEVNHPSYFSQGTSFPDAESELYESWDDFLEEFGDCDLGFNFVVRWDWQEGEDYELKPYAGDDYYRRSEAGHRAMLQCLRERRG
jgi:hypothetical protein